MASLALEDISFSYPSRGGPIPALDKISIRVQDAESLVILGPSGSGKTTLLRLIAGLETPTAGTIRIAGTDVSGVPPRKRNMAMVFQQFALYPHMTVRDNLAFGLRMRRTSSSEVDEAIRAVSGRLGLADLLQRKPAQLSGGEKQRVALGRAIVRKPNLFLFDEPLSNLDPALRSQSRLLIKQVLRASATTAVYVTHDQQEAIELADRVAVLHRGRIQQCARPDEMFERPANQFVATFFGSPTMNLISCDLRAEGGHAVCTGIGLRLSKIEMLSHHTIAQRPVVLGIRPHDIEILPSGSNRPTSGICVAPARVQSVEYLGDAMLIRLDTGDTAPIVAKVLVQTQCNKGDQVQLGFPRRRMHFFDRDSGTRLSEMDLPPNSAATP